MALYIQQREQNTEAARQFNEVKRQRAGTNLDGGYNYIKLARMAYYVNKDEYLDTLSKHIAELKIEQPIRASEV
ncbi:hypothetical protein [Psychrobacter celer]|uniref:hypothetical protein n=1 Tax=Psychrobacter celer TaxID=306572 RepID=UPI003FCF4859